METDLGNTEKEKVKAFSCRIGFLAWSFVLFYWQVTSQWSSLLSSVVHSIFSDTLNTQINMNVYVLAFDLNSVIKLKIIPK